MKRVLVIVPFGMTDADVARRAKQSTRIGVTGLRLDYRPVRFGPTSFNSPHDWTLLDTAVLEAGATAEHEGYDGVVIDTVSDSGCEALRSILHIPVVAPGRLSLVFALTLGRQFGVVAQWSYSLVRYRKVLDEWGLADRCAGVEHLDVPPDYQQLLEGKEDETFPRMAEAAERLVSAGADVVCLGSTTMSGARDFLTEHLTVPVVDPGPLSYRILESMLALGLTHSRAAYPMPVADRTNALKDLFDRSAVEHT